MSKDFEKELALRICKRLKSAGYETYLVGGCVRDMVMGREPHDFDIATAALPDQIVSLFEHTIPIGEAFGVINVCIEDHTFEVATFRADGVYTDGRRPDGITFSSAVEDVKRRDFTINALLMDPETGEVFDHVGGLDDIGNRVIRTVGNPKQRFSEDKLRMLRAIRFSVQLGFRIDEEITDAIGELHDGLQSVSRERVTEELTKMYRADPGRAFSLMRRAGIIVDAAPHIDALPDRISPIYRIIGMMNRLSATELSSDDKEAAAWALSVYHLKADAEDVLRKHFRLSNEKLRRIIMLWRNFDVIESVDSIKSSAGFKLFSRSDADVFINLQKCILGNYHRAIDAASDILLRFQVEPIEWKFVPTGSMLIERGFKPGPLLGLALKAAEDAVIMGQVKSLEEAIEVALIMKDDK